MRKRLILMRHAKSGWEHSLSDHERSLTPRGTRAAAAMGDWLKKNNYHVDQAYVSTARRTRETYDYLDLRLDKTKIQYQDKLYLAPETVLFDTLKQATGSHVLIIAHNPGIAECANHLARTRPNHIGFEHYPSAATWVAEMDLKTWSTLTPHSGKTLDFCVPKDLWAA